MSSIEKKDIADEMILFTNQIAPVAVAPVADIVCDMDCDEADDNAEPYDTFLPYYSRFVKFMRLRFFLYYVYVLLLLCHKLKSVIVISVYLLTLIVLMKLKLINLILRQDRRMMRDLI